MSGLYATKDLYSPKARSISSKGKEHLIFERVPSERRHYGPWAIGSFIGCGEWCALGCFGRGGKLTLGWLPCKGGLLWPRDSMDIS